MVDFRRDTDCDAIWESGVPWSNGRGRFLGVVAPAVIGEKQMKQNAEQPQSLLLPVGVADEVYLKLLELQRRCHGAVVPGHHCEDKVVKADLPHRVDTQGNTVSDRVLEDSYA
jgi:hypothetical protein